MTPEEIMAKLNAAKARIAELEKIKISKNEHVQEQRKVLATKQVEVETLTKEITLNTWENTPEYQEWLRLTNVISFIDGI